MAQYLLERDALNGKEGKAFATIEGRNVEMFGLKKIQVDADFQEVDFKVVGTRLVQKKTTGVALTGSADLYYGTPEFLAIVQKYVNTGVMTYFTIQIVNDDPATTVGRQIVALYNVKLQKAPLALLDAEAEFLSSSISFSFTSIETLEAFKAPAQLGG
jgi:hypothetical protein